MSEEMKNDDAQPQGNAENVPNLLRMAAAACDGGNPVLGMHLYLAAFGFASKDEVASEDAIRGLKRAWSVAYSLKERALAEYIYEKMEPYLTADEEHHCATQLQELAFDRLADFGISKEAIENMTNMFGGDFGMGNAQLLYAGKIPGAPVSATIDVPEIDGELPEFLQAFAQSQQMVSAAEEADVEEAEAEVEDPETVDFSRFDDVPEDGFVEVAEEHEEAEPDDVSAEPVVPEVGQRYQPPAQKSYVPADDGPTAASEHDAQAKALAEAFEKVRARMVPQAATTDVSRAAEKLTYVDIAGYQTTIDNMASMGIGVAHDPDFQALVKMLNERHGLDRMPAADSLVFRAPAREDAARFVQATVGEIGLPCLRMSMEENAMGMPVLCVMADANSRPKMNAAKNAFTAPAVLVIENLDSWVAPAYEQGEGIEGLVMNQLGRGAREAVNLIHSAVEDPEVYVLASLSAYGEVDPFFCDLLAPFTVVEISNPNDEERYDLWASLVNEHPSLAYIDADDVVRYSANMSRADMYLAVREAIEEAYKASLALREYEPVRPENIFEKLSAYQPLESNEYKLLEDNVVSLLREELEGSVDDFLGLNEDK